MIRARGINYDTGFRPGGKNSRTTFHPETVRREMRVIAQDLHCSAVRITGADPERLSIAGRFAAEAGLEVWFAPFLCELTTAEMAPVYAECAERAEEIRLDGATVVLITGCEMSLFASGFLPGETVYERIANLGIRGAKTDFKPILHRFLGDVATDARKRFGGQITYASGIWEDVDWTPFDIVAADAYRDRTNALFYRQLIRRYVRTAAKLGKPFAATEFGCCTYRGAARKGGMGWAIVGDDGRLNGPYVRSEAEQVAYLQKLLKIFASTGVDSAFWFTFATYESPHRDDPSVDLDMGAYGVVKMIDGEQWQPKESFHALAAAYLK